MADFEIKFSDKVDLNVAIDGGANDTGVTYSIPDSMKTLATVDAAGVVTPIRPGVVLVEARDASNNILKKFIVVIKQDAQAKFEQEVKAGTKSVVAAIAKLLGANDKTPPTGGSLAASWATDVLKVDFATLVDDESGIKALTLDVRSQDGLNILANAVSVLGASSPQSFARTADGKTYDVKLVATNNADLTSELTASVTVPASAATPRIDILTGESMMSPTMDFDWFDFPAESIMPGGQTANRIEFVLWNTGTMSEDGTKQLAYTTSSAVPQSFNVSMATTYTVRAYESYEEPAMPGMYTRGDLIVESNLWTN